ncbi:manganese efflux pump MntP family protein [Ruminococcus sp. FC2018]|uniref:manganese efflux pump MntP n=1 Tax=Ruminococcus sp. FC2018 TaxID=1410617 RepID=UPI00048EDB01|nr:manganese efflux pump MntP family protein [Ruminococcus sp. FC2018]
MFLINTLFLALSLSMDAFAVSVCKGLGMKKINWRNAFIIGAFFGAFQAIMPLIGWAVGRQFARFMTSVSHWVAFGLLVFIGAKMLIDAFKGSEEEIDQGLDYKELFILAVATSIDALAVGVVFAFENTPVLPSVLIIGTVTFALSVTGVAVGNRAGAKYNKKAQAAGGVILILLGGKILLEGLGII